jgi:hypothetical protein
MYNDNAPEKQPVRFCEVCLKFLGYAIKKSCCEFLLVSNSMTTSLLTFGRMCILFTLFVPEQIEAVEEKRRG